MLGTPWENKRAAERRQISALSICIFQTAVFSFADTACPIYAFYIPPNNQTDRSTNYLL